VDLEYHLEQYFYQRACSLFHRDYHSGYLVTAYLWLLFVQIQNLFRIVDARSLGVPAAAVRLIAGA
jgi:hypothetical protein